MLRWQKISISIAYRVCATVTSIAVYIVIFSFILSIKFGGLLFALEAISPNSLNPPIATITIFALFGVSMLPGIIFFTFSGAGRDGASETLNFGQSSNLLKKQPKKKHIKKVMGF